MLPLGEQESPRSLTRTRSSLSPIEARTRTGRAAKATEPPPALLRAQAPSQEPTSREKVQRRPRTVSTVLSHPIMERRANIKAMLLPLSVSLAVRRVAGRVPATISHPRATTTSDMAHSCV